MPEHNRGFLHLTSDLCLPAIALATAGLLITAGCASTALNSARQNFHLGRFDEASSCLKNTPSNTNDKVLFLMERATINQARQEYEDSTRDWLAASELAEKLDYYSVSKGAASFAVNDSVMAFRGAPYERTLLHAFAAKSYLALSMWDDAAVEARNIISRLENLQGFPDDAYSHYLAGFCLEMQGDPDGAAFQYRAVSNLLPTLYIDENTGRITPREIAAVTNQNIPDNPKLQPQSKSPNPQSNFPCELVCFVLMERTPSERNKRTGNQPSAGVWGGSPYAEIFTQGNYLGRSYLFSNTHYLMGETEKKLVALRATKATTRIILKSALADAVAQQNETLGALLRLILLALESPDTRRWETLPIWLEIARVPCPRDMKSYEIIFKNGNGQIILNKTIDKPLSRRGNIYFSFCRNLVFVPPAQTQDENGLNKPINRE